MREYDRDASASLVSAPAKPPPPDAPVRAAGVRLIGELKGSGFVDDQYLVERHGRFIQVSELLYRTLEHATGERRLDEIAERLTDESEWLVTADDVSAIVERKLTPLGLIQRRKNAEHADAAPTQLRSPLGVNLRVKAIGPRVLDPVTALLQYAFAPPVLVAALLVAVAAHLWMYRVHGLASAVLDALYTPGFVLILLALTVLSGAAHELGHASALRYGGGRARRMGFGFYLVFPAFFTDVTDSYRLGRWGRVRTGLGGVYFHLLFATALIAAALASGQDYLLLAVLLINVEIVRQLIPLVRLDGYWVLADLTGVPDFLSQAGPFVRSLLPAHRVNGTRLPRLKPWARRVFIAYLVVTVPLIAALVVLMVRSMPTLATMVWDAVATQLNVFSEARTAGDVVGMATAAAELLVLVLPVVGMAYIVYQLSSTPLRAAWRLDPGVRRTTAVTAVAVVLALVAVYWAPLMPFTTQAAPMGVRTVAVAERAHVRGHVDYAHNPPVGGAHAPVWQNCGFYRHRVPNELAVHSLEHGAVWIAYQPTLPEADVAALRSLAHSQSHVLVSPVSGMPASVVASSWGRQLYLSSVRDARLKRFVSAFRRSSAAPEPAGPCTGGKGRPQ